MTRKIMFERKQGIEVQVGDAIAYMPSPAGCTCPDCMINVVIRRAIVTEVSDWGVRLDVNKGCRWEDIVAVNGKELKRDG